MRTASLLIFALVSTLLSLGSTAAVAADSQTTISPANTDTNDFYQQKSFQSCLTDLNSLKSLDMGSYQRQKRVLDASMHSASQYLLMRPKLSVDMRSVMDSVYQAKISRNCLQIHNKLFSLLLTQADGADSK